MPNNSLSISKADSWKLFDEISPRYDLLNHLLSFGLDIHWRSLIHKYLKSYPRMVILDLATGTADVLISILQKLKNVDNAYGIDLADRMLEIGRRKIIQKGLSATIDLKHGDANKIPFENNSFHNITMAFGIRNIEKPEGVLKEMIRALKPQGRAVILEFSLPKNKIFRMLHIFYLRTVVPLVGAAFSGHYRAYKYLNQTIETFPYGEAFCELMRKNGFKDVQAHPLLWGVATIYRGDKSC